MIDGAPVFALITPTIEHDLDVAISKFAAELLLEHLEIMRAGRKLGGGFGSVAAEPGQRDHPSVDIGVAKPRHDCVVVGARIGNGLVALPADG